MLAAWYLTHTYLGLQPSIERQKQQHDNGERSADRRQPVCPLQRHAMSSIHPCSAVIIFGGSVGLSAGLHRGFELMYLGFSQPENVALTAPAGQADWGSAIPPRSIARMLSVAATCAVALCQLGGSSAQLVCGPLWSSVQVWCSYSPIIRVVNLQSAFMGHVLVDYCESAGIFGRVRPAFWPMQSRITGFESPYLC